MMRRERRNCRVRRCVQVSLRNSEAHGRAIGVAGQNQRPASRHDDQIAVGVTRLRAVLSKRRNRNVDEGRIDFRKIVEAEMVARHVAGVVRLDKKIRTLDEAKQELAAGVALDVERDCALVAIVRPPVQRPVRMRRVVVKRPDRARCASARRLDLDDVRAHVAEHLAT